MIVKTQFLSLGTLLVKHNFRTIRFDLEELFAELQAT